MLVVIKNAHFKHATEGPSVSIDKHLKAIRLTTRDPSNERARSPKASFSLNLKRGASAKGKSLLVTMASLYSSMLSDENVPSSPIAADDSTPAGGLEQEEVTTVIQAAELGLAISTSLSPPRSGEKSPRKRRRREVDFTYSPRARGSKAPRHESTNDVNNDDVSPSEAILAVTEAVKSSQEMEVAETSHQTGEFATDAHAEIWSDPEETVSVMTPTHKRVKVKPSTRSPLVKFFRQLVGVVEEEESHTEEQTKPVTMEILTQAVYEEEVVEIIEQEIPDVKEPNSTSTIAREEEDEGAAPVAAEPTPNRDAESPIRSDTDDLLTQQSYTPRQSPIPATHPEVFSPQLLDSGHRDPSASPQLIDDREVPSQPSLERSQPSTPLRNKRTHKKRQPVLDLPKMDRVLVLDGPAITKRYANWSHGAALPSRKARNDDEADGGRSTSVAPESVLGDDSVLELDSLVTQDGNSMTDVNAEVRPNGLAQQPSTRNQASSDVRRLAQPHANQPEASRASRILTPKVQHNAGESIITLNDLLPSVGVPEDFEDFVISLDGTTPYSIAFNPAWKGKEREPDAAVIL